jgi:hypothetical protein
VIFGMKIYHLATLNWQQQSGHFFLSRDATTTTNKEFMTSQMAAKFCQMRLPVEINLC